MADFEIIERARVHEGFIPVERLKLRHALFAGGVSEVLTREIYNHRSCVGVLPYDPVHDTVVLVEQFRVGALEAPGGPWLIEIIAGMVEEGEDVVSVAHRESDEEAGCRLDALMHICDYVVTPGVSSERITLYCARADSQGVGGIHGLDHEGEDIKVHVVPVDEAYAMVEDGRIHAAMPIIDIQWLMLHRDAVRRQWGC